MSTGCCSAHPLSREHIGAALSTAGSTITPAKHAAGLQVGHAAETLVVGTIATGNPAAPLAEAMAISGGVIIGIGALKDVEGLTDSSTTTVTPEGVVIPGLIEPHMHIWSSLLNLTWTDVSHEVCATFDDVVATLKQTAARTPAGQYVLGKLFDPSLFPGEPDLTRDILDQIAPNNPVLVMNASMHYLYANSAAFELGRVSYIRSQTADSTASIPGTAMSRSIRAIASTAPTRERSAPVEMSPGEPVTANSWRAVLSSLARAVSVGMESLLRCASLRRYARAALSSIGMPAYPGG
ncbi:amidohydrolase family protein [Aurantimicrobium minutum]|uniref:amidohydrolase family protein n=1 Tax=Aurantimicrobium minutum TaxID=708131 RepID=UPI00248E474B|nr:amidohydrolase family protein [Aurantimicrobium minutum]